VQSILRAALVAGVAAGAIAAAAFWSVGHPWTLRFDNEVVVYPMTLEAYRRWMAGEVPAWSNGLWAGFPLLAEPQTAGFYVPHLLPFWLTPDPHLRAFDLATALHAGILVAGIVRLLGEFAAPPAVALFGGALALLSGEFQFWAAGFLPWLAAVSWWPWMLLAAERLAHPEAALGRALALGSATLAAQLLAGHPEPTLYGATFAGLWLVTRQAGLPLRRRLARVVSLGVLAALLAAPQLLSSAVEMRDSTRTAAPAFGSLAPLQEAGGVVDPRVVSGPMAHGFVGGATLVLAMAAVILRAPRAPFLALLAVGAWILTLGDRTPLLALLKAVPPFHLFRMPTKFFLITELAVICLAALGLGRLASGGRRLRTGMAVALALVAVGERAAQSVLRFRAYEEVTAAGEPLAARMQLLADYLVPWAQLRDGSAPPPRVLVDAPLTRFGNLTMIYEVESLRGGVPGLLSPRHDRLDRPLSPDELDALGVELVFSPAWACPPPRLPGFVVVSSRGMCLVRNPHRPTRYDFANAGDGSVEVTAYRPGDVELRVATRSPRAILARESWKPGWQAQVDGRPAPVHPAADGLFFTVDVPPGVHLVRLTYRQPGLALGLAGAGTWFGLVLAGAWARHQRERRHRG